MSLAEIEEALKVMVLPGDIVELRIFDHYNKKYCGWFNDIHKMAEAAVAHDDTAEGIYYTCNACVPEMLAVANNRVIPCQTASTEGNIQRRRILGIDIDPVRNPVKISSTDPEKKLAYNRAIEVRTWLCSQGFPSPVLGDSGNGYHLDYFVDLPVTPEIKKLYDDFFKVLKLKFPKDGVDVQGFPDSNRIWKVYGTVARKGENLPDRPHRRSKLLEIPDKRDLVTSELLQKIADMLPKEEPKAKNGFSSGKSWDSEKLRKWLESHGAVIERTKQDGNTTRFILKTCLINPEHEGHREAEVHIDSNGIIGYKCHHNSCNAAKWTDVRDKYEPGDRDRNPDRQPTNTIESSENALTLKEILNLRNMQESRKLTMDVPDDHFISNFKKWISSTTDAYSDYSIVCALSLLSAACKGRVYLSLKQEKIKTNLWVFILGNSTTSRKSTVINKTQAILNAAFTINEGPESYSYEGYIEYLSTHPIAFFARDEVAGLLCEYDKKYMAGVVDVECSLYEGKNFSRTLAHGRSKELREYKISNPYIVKLYSTTPDSFARYTQIEDLTSGWLFRFLFVNPNYKKPYMPLDVETQENIEAWGHVLTHLKTIHSIVEMNGEIKFKIEREALRFIQKAQQELEESAASENNQIYSAAIGRAVPYAFKIAMLLEIGKQEPSFEISIHSMIQGYRGVVEYFIPTLIDVAQRLEEDIRRNDISKVIYHLNRKNGIATHSILLHDTKLLSRVFKECIDTLLESHQIERIPQKDSKVTWYKLNAQTYYYVGDVTGHRIDGCEFL